MDDRRIEDMLRESWQPEPPDGMRDRTLRLARKELSNKQTRILGISRWKLALVAFCIAIVLLTNAANSRVDNRIDAIVCRRSAGCSNAQVAQMMTAQQWQQQQSRMMDSLYN